MRSFSFIRIILPIALSSFCVVAQAQQSGVGGGARKTETSKSSGAITGKVVNESGQPLANAIVRVYVAGANGTEQGAATDREGMFRVNDLEPDLSYHVNASMPAYTTPRSDSGVTAPRTYRVGDSVTLTLVKGGVITGRVTNATGDPVVGIRVRAEMVMRARNGRRLANGWAGEKVTDDRGVYRIYGLPSGQYVVLAGGAANSYTSSNVDPFDTDVPTFAPSSTRDTASEISVRSGEEISGVDISYRGEQGHLISGTVTGASQGFNVTLTVVGDGIVPWSGTSYPEWNGRTFSFVGIADGDYDLYARSYGQNQSGISEVKRLRVRGADITGIELTTRPFASVAGRVVLEETYPPECTEKSRPLFEEMTVGAWHNDTEAAKEVPESAWARGVPVKPDAQGNFLVRNLAPGEYHFIARLAAKNWYVRSIQFAPAATSGAKKPVDATRVWTNLKFGDQLSGLAITLVPGGGSLRGQLVLGEGEKAGRTYVYLAPVERERAENTLSYFGTPVPSDGKIAINNIPPGRYWILAQTVAEDAPVPFLRMRFPHETETRTQLRREAEAAKSEIEFKPCQNVVDYKLPPKPAGQ